MLTKLEQMAMKALLIESAGNGHDFGLMELVEWTGSRKQLGGLVANLIKKGLITHIETVDVNGGPKRGGERYTQYVLSESALSN